MNIWDRQTDVIIWKPIQIIAPHSDLLISSALQRYLKKFISSMHQREIINEKQSFPRAVINWSSIRHELFKWQNETLRKFFRIKEKRLKFTTD